MFPNEIYKLTKGVGGHSHDLKSIGNKVSKVPFMRTIEQRSWLRKKKKQRHIIWQKTLYWKVLLQKMLELKSRNHQAGFTASPHGISYVLEDSYRVEHPPGSYIQISEFKEFHILPMSSLLDDFWSQFLTLSEVQPFNKIYYVN